MECFKLNNLLSEAISDMAMSPKKIQERLLNVCNTHFIAVNAQEIPEKFRKQYIEIKKMLTSKKAIGNEGAIQATLKSMRTEKAIKITQMIIDLASEVNECYYDEIRKPIKKVLVRCSELPFPSKKR